MPSDMIQNPKKSGHCMAITMRSGKSLPEPTPASIEQEESIERNAEKERLKKKSQYGKFMRLISMLWTLPINIPLVEVLEQMPGYAKFMKYLVTKKGTTSFEPTNNVHNCSDIATRSLVQKKEDPGAFTIPCTIGAFEFTKALYFKVDFEVPIILGRPYLATSRALVDVESGELKFWLKNEEVKFKVCKLMKQPHDMSVVSAIDIVEERVTESSIEERFTLETLVADKPTTKPSIEEPHVLELKQLPGHLRYVFLGENKTLLVIVAANLNVEQVQTLVKVLKRFKKAIGWTIADIIGIPPVKCVPKIGGITVVANAKNELIPQRSVIDWWCAWITISIALEDQEKTTFACPYSTFAFKHMPFGLCNALATFQRCMIYIFSDMVEDTLEVLAATLDLIPWFANFPNYLVSELMPEDLTFQQRKKFLHDVSKYFWDEPYLYRVYADNIISRCVPEAKMLSILEACHSSPVGGHHVGTRTAHKVFQSGYYWLRIHQNTFDMVKGYDISQMQGVISHRHELPMTPILEVELFDIWGIEFMGVVVLALAENKGKSVAGFSKKNIFSKLGTPRVITSDRGSHFCNKVFSTLLAKYGVKQHKVAMSISGKAEIQMVRTIQSDPGLYEGRHLLVTSEVEMDDPVSRESIMTLIARLIATDSEAASWVANCNDAEN
ncbi:uncharacterized protein LOC125842747 [Solanum stenotomum]|uniref:uncharacterized protein LOC125842747 n=1 Tax=Solanum stenotomum TaxID=172797 RepID=UPI0020D02A73|nr:uncharacterized protein LOC125842747 [Solanum stenotomum]